MDELAPMIAKHKQKIREMESELRVIGEDQIQYSSDLIIRLINEEKIPKDLGDWFLKDLNKKTQQHEEMQKLIKEHPEIAPEERWKHFFKQGVLSPDETANLYEDASMSCQFMLHLFKNRHLISEDTENENVLTHPLFNDIDVDQEFGIANCISNSLYHLAELLQNMKTSIVHEALYEATGSVTNSKGESISLAYTFPASSEDEAKQLLEKYQSTMVSKGLKCLMAYWIMANKAGRVEYSCPMIEIMKMVADEDRTAPFSVKEKEEHWEITKMLGMSRLSRARKVKKRGTGAEMVQWIEQPLVEILGGEKEMTAEDKYPNALAVRVLMPRIDTKGFSPTIYKNKTALLSPSDVLLALVIQTRATQRGRGSKEIHYDWDFIFSAGNLQTTASTNHRGAKAKARKKMDRLQENEIIEKWDEELLGVRITPKPQKAKSKSKDPQKKS